MTDLGLYTYTGLGLSALLVSITWAMPEPLLRGTSDRTGSTLYLCISRCSKLVYSQNDFILMQILFFFEGAMRAL